MPTPPGNLPDRLNDLELLFTHLQRSVQDLDDVSLDREKRVSRLESQFKNLNTRLSNLGHALKQPPTDPKDEKPPHY